VPVPAVPENLPDVIVSSPADEAVWRAKGWEPLGSPQTHELAGPTKVAQQAEEAIHGSPEMTPGPTKRPSGAHWRKLARERAAQQEASR
jgi:hypothetical protein